MRSAEHRVAARLGTNHSSAQRLRLPASRSASPRRRAIRRHLSQAGDAAHLPADHRAARLPARRLLPEARARRGVSLRRTRRPAEAAHAPAPAPSCKSKSSAARSPSTARKRAASSPRCEASGRASCCTFTSATSACICCRCWKSAHLPVIVRFHGADAQIDLDKPAHLAAHAPHAGARDPAARPLRIARRRGSSRSERSAGKIRLHRTGIPLEEIPSPSAARPPTARWRCVQACRLDREKGARHQPARLRGIRARVPARHLHHRRRRPAAAASSRRWRRRSASPIASPSRLSPAGETARALRRSRIFSSIPANSAPTATRKACRTRCSKPWPAACPSSRRAWRHPRSRRARRQRPARRGAR